MEFNKAICDNLEDQPDLDITLEQLSECYGAHYDDEISSKLICCCMPAARTGTTYCAVQALPYAHERIHGTRHCLILHRTSAIPPVGGVHSHGPPQIKPLLKWNSVFCEEEKEEDNYRFRPSNKTDHLCCC